MFFLIRLNSGFQNNVSRSDFYGFVDWFNDKEARLIPAQGKVKTGHTTSKRSSQKN